MSCPLALPRYDGNGKFRSVGNAQVNRDVGMPFIDFEKPQRLRTLTQAAVYEQTEI
jgi:hypothetical protein